MRWEATGIPRTRAVRPRSADCRTTGLRAPHRQHRMNRPQLAVGARRRLHVILPTGTTVSYDGMLVGAPRTGLSENTAQRTVALPLISQAVGWIAEGLPERSPAWLGDSQAVCRRTDADRGYWHGVGFVTVDDVFFLVMFAMMATGFTAIALVGMLDHPRWRGKPRRAGALIALLWLGILQVIVAQIAIWAPPDGISRATALIIGESLALVSALLLAAITAASLTQQGHVADQQTPSRRLWLPDMVRRGRDVTAWFLVMLVVLYVLYIVAKSVYDGTGNLMSLGMLFLLVLVGIFTLASGYLLQDAWREDDAFKAGYVIQTAVGVVVLLLLLIDMLRPLVAP